MYDVCLLASLSLIVQSFFSKDDGAGGIYLSIKSMNPTEKQIANKNDRKIFMIILIYKHN